MPNVGHRQAAAGIDTSVPPEDRYEIVGRIASGGMAEIYLARLHSNRGQPRECVLKRLMPELQSDQEFVQMFYDEANIASQLRHPNVVNIFELGELDGSLFISMELLRGVNLRDLLARLHGRNAELPAPLAIRIACCALDALDYAHAFADSSGRRLNVVHRDVSPQNIIVTYDGSAKLVDFGVAKAEGRLHQTRAGLIKGKFAYMSPEQVSGGAVDGRSDLFALAEVFYELLLKRHPFYAESDMEVLRAILDKDPPHPSALDPNFPAALGEIFMRAMRKAPGDRYATAGEMLNAFEHFLQENRTPAPSSELGRFMSDLFRDRIDAEREARARGDDDALIDALVQGRSEEEESQPPPDHHGGGRRQQPPSVVIDEHSSADALPRGERDRVVEISRSPEPVSDPAEAGAPAFLAHSGYQNPGLSRRRFQSQVRGLFDEDDDAALEGPTNLEMPAQATPAADDGELPTMLGTLSAEEMAELRSSAARARSDYSPGVQVAPARAPQPQVSVGPVDPAMHSGPRISRQLGPGPQQPQTPQPPHPVHQPRQQQYSDPAQQVTPRSRTVLQNDGQPAPKSDKLGLIFFIAGLGALIGAVGYAVWLWQASQSPLVEVSLTSTPAGARIILDGADTGAKTPHRFSNLAGDKPHSIEFRLDGYEPCVKALTPTTKAKATIDCPMTKK